MKQIITTTLCLLFIGVLFAQEPITTTMSNKEETIADILEDFGEDLLEAIEGLDTDSIPDKKEDKEFNINLSLGKKRVKTRFFLMDLGINSYHNEGQPNLPSSLETFQLNHGRSVAVNLHVYRQRIRVGNGVFNVEHGLSFDLNHYAFQNKVVFNDGAIPTFAIDGSSDIRRSRLYISRLTIPLMLHFETFPRKLRRSLHVGVGGYASLRLASNLKTKLTGRDKERVADDFGLNDFMFGARVELGFGPVNLYAKYAFTDLFKTGQGPSLTPFSIGFMVIPF